MGTKAQAEATQPVGNEEVSDLAMQEFFAATENDTDGAYGEDFADGVDEGTEPETSADGDKDAAGASSSQPDGEEEETVVPPAAEEGEPPQAPTETPSVTPEEEVVSPPEAVSPPVEAPPATEQPQPEITAEQQKSLREAALKELQRRYAINDEQVELLREQPDQVLPEIAANLYMDIYQNVMQSVLQTLPNLVQTHNARQRAQQESEERFYGAWPKLNTDVGRQTAQRLATVYRQVYPQATQEQFINDVGLQAMISLKLPIEGAHVVPVQPNAAPPSPPPARPASPTTAPASRKVTSKNQFEMLADEIIEEDI